MLTPDTNLQPDPAADADAKRAHDLFESSKTFLMRSPDPRVMRLRIITVAGLLVVFFVVIPLLGVGFRFRGLQFAVSDDKVNILGQYMCFAIVALGIDLIWGYTGLLSLCQALFFALGGYAMAMHLSLPEGGGQYDYPQFMTFAYYGHGTNLPWFWAPFRHFWFALLAGIAVPGLIAGLFGFVVLRNRVRGVYFSIITQAFASACYLLISRNEMLLGGTNGLTNFYRPMTADRPWKIGLYFLTLCMLVLAYLFCRAIAKSRVGRVMIAVRDKETRLYFAGYKPFAFKVFAFTVAAMLAGIGGMLYAPQVTLIAPQEMNVEASMLVVVMVALGGRGRLWGAVLGALLFRSMRSTLSSDLSAGWIGVQGLIAIVVVLAFPDGLLGIWERLERQLTSGEPLLKLKFPSDPIINFCLVTLRIILTAVPLVTLCAFALCEALGLMPRFMSDITLNLAFSQRLLYAVLLGAGLLYWRQRTKANWGLVGGLLGFDLLVGLFFPTKFTPQFLREITHMEIPIKYLIILTIFGFCTLLEWLCAVNASSVDRSRGFEVLPPKTPASNLAVAAVIPLPAVDIKGGA